MEETTNGEGGPYTNPYYDVSYVEEIAPADWNTEEYSAVNVFNPICKSLASSFHGQSPMTVVTPNGSFFFGR